MAQYTFDINKAMQMGATPEQIDQYLRAQQAQGKHYVNLPASPQDASKPKGGFKDLLPTLGGVAGGIVGGVVAGPVGAVAGGAIGSGLGETGREALDSTPGFQPGEILKQTGEGAVGSVVGEGVGRLAGKVLPKVASGTASRLMNSVYKEPVKATKAAMVKGETLGEQALARGQAGTTKQLYDTANSQINNTEGTIQQLAMGSTEKVAMEDIRKTVQPLIDKYVQSGNTTAVKALQKRLDALEVANGSNMPTAAAQEIKKSLYEEIQKAYGQQASPELEGIKAIARGFKEQVANKIPGVDQLNKDLSFYGRARNSMLDKMTRDERNNALGLTDTIIGGAGLSAGGIPAAITGVAIKKGLGSTATRTYGAKVLNALPKSPTAAFAGNVTAQTAGQGVTRTLLPATPEVDNGVQINSNDSNNQNNPNHNNLPPFPGANSSINNTISQAQGLSADPAEAMAAANGVPSRDILAREYTKSIAAGDYGTASKLKGMFDDFYGKTGFFSESSKTVSQAQQQRDDLAYMVQEATDQFSSTNPKTGPLAPQIEELKSTFNAGDPATIQFDRTISGLKAAIAKARAGTSFTPNEEKLLNNYAPAIGDSRQQIMFKLMGLQSMLQASQGRNISGSATSADPNQLPPTP